MVTETSKQAFESIQEKLGIKQQLVLDGLKTLDMANNTMISRFLGIPINQVTPRMVELRDKKLVTFSHESPCPWTQKNTEFWKLTKWGEELSEPIVNVKCSRLVYRPYIIEQGFDTTVFKCCSRDIKSNDWHDVEIVRSGLGELKSVCDCYDFQTNKQCSEDCKHITALKEHLIKDGEL